MVLLAGCGMSNPAVQKEHKKIITLEKKKLRLERDYHMILSHLEKHPNARELRLKKAELKKQIVEVGMEIKESRQQLDIAVQQWEDRVLTNRVEQNMVDEEERKQRPQYRY
jgi:hypothetical protein